MLELIVGVLVTFVAVGVVLEPLIPRPGARPAAAPAAEEPEFIDIEESESPKIQALLALKEIEFDRATGKLSDEDYNALKAKYQQVALAAIDAEEQEGTPGAGTPADAAEELIKRAREAKVCPNCGPRPEADAAFCSDCGRKLAASAPSSKSGSFCDGCGASLSGGAKFCGECGAKVEAATAPVS
jgi:hypothetical protein